MDQVTQQNAAMVEEMSTAAATLKWETTELNRQMSHFRWDFTPSDQATAPLADADMHRPSPNIVAQVQARLAKLPANFGAATAEDLRRWDGF